MIHPLQYISQGATGEEQLQAIEKALAAGCTWIQLRVKGHSEEALLAIAQKARLLCDQYNAKLIVNDCPVIARQCKADGVHLGLNDMPVEKAREFLGGEYLIGGTANTLEDVRKQIKAGADYVGLGPFRFTTTKEKLSPVVGLEGYISILQALTETERRIPIIAVGGIQGGDIPALMEVGVYGVAVSGAITQANDAPNTVRSMIELVRTAEHVANSR